MISMRNAFFGCMVVMAVLVGAAGNRWADVDESVVHRAQTTEKIAAITIDDGPHEVATPRMLDALRAENVKATFFVLGKSAEQYPELVKKVLAEGHEVATHGYSHRNMARLSRQECEAEWEKTEQILTPLGAKVTLFRPPGGSYGQVLTDGAKARGYHMILWDVDPRDWQAPPADVVAERITQAVRPGSIILLHDGQYPIHSADALRKVVRQLKEEGYSFVTVGELLGRSAGGQE